MNPQNYSSNSQERYIIFCRAVAEQDADAWADIVGWCRPLLIGWARKRLATLPIEERCDDVADEAFARAWAALIGARLDRFPNIAAVLGYLRACVASVAADRARAHADKASPLSELEIAPDPTPEQAALAEARRAEIWARVEQHIVSEQERVVVYESMALSLPPRAILLRHPALFESVAAIYVLKRNLFDRLRRDEGLRQLNDE